MQVFFFDIHLCFGTFGSIQKVTEDLKTEFAKYDCSDLVDFPQHIVDETVRVARFSQATAFEAHLVQSLSKPDFASQKTACLFYFTAFAHVKQEEILPQLWTAGKACTIAAAPPVVPILEF